MHSALFVLFRIFYIPAFIAGKQVQKQQVELENESLQTSASKPETLLSSNQNVQGSLSPMPKLVYPEPRTVEVIRDQEYGLGISIVGGRQVENDQKLKGIFIKHVLETTPAGKSGLLKTGDQILEVRLINPFIHKAPFLYPLKTSENRKVEKRCIRNK